MNEVIRKKLIDYSKKEERSIAWIARHIDVNVKSLQKFAAGTRQGVCADGMDRLAEFLRGEE